MLIWWAADGPYQTYLNSGIQLREARQRLTDAQIIQAEMTKTRLKEQEISKSLASRGSGSDLWTQVDKAVKDLKLGNRCSLRTPAAAARKGENFAAVELSLTGVSAQELVDLLHRIYDTGYVVILDKLDHLKPSQDKKGLDCRMQLVAPRA